MLVVHNGVLDRGKRLAGPRWCVGISCERGWQGSARGLCDCYVARGGTG